MRGSHIGTAVALALFLAPAVASAGTLVVNINSPAGGGFPAYTGTVDLTYSGTLSGTGTLVTSVTGDINGFGDVTELAPKAFSSNDNLIYSGPAYFDVLGVAFSFDDGTQELSLFGNTSNAKHPVTAPYNDPGAWTGILLCRNAACTTSNSPIAGSIPEPATWALMLAGFGGLGAAMRTSRRRMAIAEA
jgi:hypothetical protein